MTGHVVIELRCEGTQSRQARPWYRWKVVVFIVISDLNKVSEHFCERKLQKIRTDIVGEDVEPAVIRIRFLLQSVPYIMFCNEVASQRMQAASPET